MKLELDRSILWQRCDVCSETGLLHICYQPIPDKPCPRCKGIGEIPTKFGVDLLEFISTCREMSEVL